MLTVNEAFRKFKSRLELNPLLSHRLSNEGGLNLPCLVE